jgi:hypothetical protein
MMQLVLDLRPVQPHAVAARLLAGLGTGVAVSVAMVGIWLGYRSDMSAATRTVMFWVKLGYLLAVGALALWSVERLARPGTEALSRILWLLLPLAAVAALAASQIAGAQAQDRMHMIMGASAPVCPPLIIAIAIPPLIGLVWAVRGLAPTRLRLAGAMIGLAAGGFGGGAYALHCSEWTAPFLAVWYSLGVAGCGVIGAALGPYVLRW